MLSDIFVTIISLVKDFYLIIKDVYLFIYLFFYKYIYKVKFSYGISKNLDVNNGSHNSVNCVIAEFV